MILKLSIHILDAFYLTIMMLVSDNFKSQGIGIDPSMFVFQDEELGLTATTRKRWCSGRIRRGRFQRDVVRVDVSDATMRRSSALAALQSSQSLCFLRIYFSLFHE